MHLRLLGTTYYDLEVERYIQLRSMEWEAFPVFATRAFAPVAMFWIPWWQLILILLLTSVVLVPHPKPCRQSRTSRLGMPHRQCFCLRSRQHHSRRHLLFAGEDTRRLPRTTLEPRFDAPFICLSA